VGTQEIDRGEQRVWIFGSSQAMDETSHFGDEKVEAFESRPEARA
jgi:hypothetical protein